MMPHILQLSNLNFKFYSASGTGNTFLIADITNKYVSPKKIKTPLIFALRRENKDSGLIFEKINPKLYKMRVIEKDGSESSFCGNGARVLARYLHKTTGITLSKLIIENDKKLIFGKKNNNEYYIECGRPIQLPSIKIQNIKLHHFNVCGEPHLITDNFFDQLKLYLIAKLINKSNSINVSCINGQYIITYERGVNNITQSCGSACIAATQFRLNNTSIIFDNNMMPWYCLGGTNFVETKKFILFGETELEEINPNKEVKKRGI